MDRTHVIKHTRSAVHRYELLDPNTGEHFSANAGDYWFMSPDSILDRPDGTKLWLLRDGEVYKKVVHKSDLKDEIYESQKRQKGIFRERRSVSRGVYNLSTERGDNYIIDGNGQITQRYNYINQNKSPSVFSGQWLFDGLADMYGRRVRSWDEVLKNPDEANHLRIRGGLYVRDLDNGTVRVWRGNNQKFKSITKEI